MNSTLSNFQRVIAAGFATTCVFFSTTISNAQTFDPTIFDGSHTVVPGTINQRGDNGSGPSGDWQDDSLTVYSPDGQSQQPWGVETQMPGMQGMQGQQGQQGGTQGMQGQQGGMGGMGGMGGLPPMMGGGGGGGEQGQQIPPGMEGMEGSMEGEGNGGTPPPGAEMSSGEPPPGAEPSQTSAQVSGGEMPEGPSVDVPEDMKIGDENQKIEQAQAQTPQDQGQSGDTSGDEAGEQQSSQDSTKMKSATGKQSGKRGAGSEEGDAMPADL